MRAREFIQEANKKGKVAKRHQEPTKGLHKVFDSGLNGDDFGSDYSMYRISMAAACTDGETTPQTNSKSWIGMGKTVYPYSKADDDIIKQAYKAIGVKYKDMNSGDMESRELDSTNNVSPVSNWNKKGKITTEAASAGATSSGSIASVPNAHISPGHKNMKAWSGSPGKMGSSPPQPKPRKQKPTDNALDNTNVSLFGVNLGKKKK